jgi:hypothetical protein
MMAAVVLSGVWTTWRSRRFLGKTLGRKLAKDEESSIKTWLTMSKTDLEAGARKLEHNPFQRVADLFDADPPPPSEDPPPTPPSG